MALRSRENVVTLAFVLLAFPAAYVVQVLTGSYQWSYVALLVVGIGVPTVLNERRRRRTETGD